MGGRGKKTAPSSSRRSSDRIKAKTQPPTTMEKVEEEVDEVDESSSSASVNGEQSLNSSQVLEQAFLNIVKNNRSGESSFSSPLTVNHHSEFCLDPICSNPVCIQRIQNRDPEQYRHLKFRIDGIEFSPYDNIDHHHSEIREIQARMNLLCPQTPAKTVSNLSNSNPILAADGTTLQSTSTNSVSQESQTRDSSSGNHSDPHAHDDVTIINHSDPHAHGDVSTFNQMKELSQRSQQEIGNHSQVVQYSLGQISSGDMKNNLPNATLSSLGRGDHSLHAIPDHDRQSMLNDFDRGDHSLHDQRNELQIGKSSNFNGEHVGPHHAHDHSSTFPRDFASSNLNSHGINCLSPAKTPQSGTDVTPNAELLHQNISPCLAHGYKHDDAAALSPTISDSQVQVQNSSGHAGHARTSSSTLQKSNASPPAVPTTTSRNVLKDALEAESTKLVVPHRIQSPNCKLAGEQSLHMGPTPHVDDSAHQNSANGITNTGEHADPHGTTISYGHKNDTVDPYPRELKTSLAGQNASTLVHEIVSPVGPSLAQESNLAVGKQNEHKLPISSGKHADSISHDGPGHQQIPAHVATLVNPLVQPSSSISQHGNNVHLEEFPPLQASGKINHNNVAQNHETSSTNWKGIFMGELNNSLKLNFYAYKEEDGKAVASPPAEIFHAGATHWQRCLIGQFFDKPPPFFLIQKMVDTKWKKFGAVDIRSTESGMFVFQFETEAICDMILEELWHVYHRPLLLRRWTPGTQLINLKCNRVPIWLKLIDVPLDLWHQEGLSYVASTIGFPLQMDSLTASRRHLGYARVCVEMNAEKDFPNSTLVELLDGTKAKVQIEYTWKPKKCSHCKVFGHNEVTCTAIPKETLPVPVVNITHPPKENEWKTAGNVSKNNIKTSLTTNASTKNRFDVFSVNPEIDTVKPYEPGTASTSQQTDANKNATALAPGKNVEHARKNPKYPQKAYRNAQAIFTQRGRKSSDNFNNRAKSKIDTKVRDKARKDILQSFSSPARQTDQPEGFEDYSDGEPPDWNDY